MWFAVEEKKVDPKIGMALAGTQSWGEVHALIHSDSDDPSGTDAQYYGFFLDKDIAQHVASALNEKGVSPCQDYAHAKPVEDQ